MKPILLFMQSMLQLVLSPTNGWEDIAACDRLHGPLTKQYNIFIGVVALSWLVQLIYHPMLSLLTAIELAMVTYAIFFICRFIAVFILSVALQTMMVPGTEVDEERVQSMVIYPLALLATVLLISNLLPGNTPVMWFVPLYVVVILWKARRFMSIRNPREALFVITAAISVVLPPMLLGLLFQHLI